MKKIIYLVFTIFLFTGCSSDPSIDVDAVYIESVNDADNFDKTGEKFLPNVEEFLVGTIVTGIKEKSDFTAELVYLNEEGGSIIVVSESISVQPTALYDLVFGFQKPKNGWPIGAYIVSINCTSHTISSVQLNMTISDLSEKEKAVIGKENAPQLKEISMCNGIEENSCFSSDSIFSASNGEIAMSSEIHNANNNAIVALSVFYLGKNGREKPKLTYTADLNVGEIVEEESATDFAINFPLPLNGDWSVGKYELEIEVVNQYSDKRYFTFYLKHDNEIEHPQ